MHYPGRVYAATLCFFSLVMVGAASLAQSSPNDPLEFFEKKIRPLLAERCYECHGANRQRSGLRLDHISTALEGGERGPALVPGDPAQSRLVEAIRYGNVDLQMPEKKMLPQEEIALLVRWIEMGAPWPDEPLPADGTGDEELDIEKRKREHWAWQPVIPHGPPAVVDAEWPNSGVDRFVLAKLEEAGLTPSPEADRRTLVRRLYFALVGLPPRPEEIAAFLNDTSNDAYEKLVDRLLDSPQFGERWGRHWLDLVRFAESYGHEQDYPIREAWRYRDYIIRALNADVPYDRLVREHIAGDLVKNPRIHEDGYNESVIGTGWWYMHQATHAPVDLQKDEADRIDNQIDVLSKAFLGLTVACARCHDHKFDAISTEDYYAMSAFMRGSRQHYAYLDPKGEIARTVSTLEDARERGMSKAAKSVQKMAARAAEDVPRYLMASQDVLYGTAKPKDRWKNATETFADFEGTALEPWTVEGEAFGDTPTRLDSKEQADALGVFGRGLVDSSRLGDDRKGKLSSVDFVLRKPFIHLRVGGASHRDRTSVRLVVNGETKYTASGRDDDRLYPVTWEVRDDLGKKAHFEIEDSHKEKGRHIKVDHIVFSSSPVAKRTARPLETVAKEFQLDATRLGRWVRLMQDTTQIHSSHPLHYWSKVRRPGDPPEHERAADSKNAPPQTESQDFVTFETFDNGYEDWYRTGNAFLDTPTGAGELNAVSPGTFIEPAGVAHSGLLAGALTGTLRSPTFTLRHNSVHYRMKGRSAQVRLIVGRYQLREFNGILFENTYLNLNSDEYKWVHQVGGLEKWQGQKAYIEFIDDGDGYIAIDEIRFSNGPPRESRTGSRVTQFLDGRGEVSLSQLAEAYGAWTEQALMNWSQGPIDSESYEWLSMLLRAELADLSVLEKRFSKAAKSMTRIAAKAPKPVRALAIMGGSIEDTHVFIRGNPAEPGDEVERRFLTALSPPDHPVEDDGRLGLANRITSKANPFFPRVMVNRIWRHLFGRGIVETVDNFGLLGERPSHPELLDYLAVRFRDDGYSTKSMIRLLVNTKTYRQSSTLVRTAAERADPLNKLFHRAPIRRLESEILRDAILAVSGAMNPQMFGPSVPAYLSPFMTYHRRPSKSGPMNGEGRRTIYLEVRRNFLSEMQLTFDMPLPDSTTGRRTVSNLPAQSLILMNDPFVAEQAGAWGEAIAADGRAPKERIITMCERAWGRVPPKEIVNAMQSFILEQGKIYGLSLENAAHDRRVWGDLGHVLFMAKEFLFVG